MARMCRKFHDHSYSTGGDIAMYISSLFFLSIISFGEKMQRRTKAAHNEHYIDIFVYLFTIKKERNSCGLLKSF